MALVLRASFIAALAALLGCPVPLSSGPSGPARVPPDASVVVRLPAVVRAEEAARALLRATRGAEERSDLEALLSFVVEGKTPGSALFGLAKDRSILVSWREGGEVMVALPVDDPALFSLALDRLLALRDLTRSSDALGVRVYVDDDGQVAMLARVFGGGALLWPLPRDAFAAAALLDAMADGRVLERWPAPAPPSSPRAAVEVVASGVGLAQISPLLAAVFGGPQAVRRAYGELVVERGDARLHLGVELTDEAIEPLVTSLEGAGEPPPGFCALSKGALAIARAPVTLLERAGEEGPLSDLDGQLGIGLFPSTAGAGPGWVAVGAPLSLSGREDLLASVRAGGVVEQAAVQRGARTVRTFSPTDAPTDTALLGVFEDDVVALAFKADDALFRALDQGDHDACLEAPEGKGFVYLRVEPRALTASLSEQGGKGVAEPGPLLALRRLADRLPRGFSRIEARVTMQRGVVSLDATGALADAR